jgi:endonuclease/exonuclease/phosphatase (EEP) superfamily protein YafD
MITRPRFFIVFTLLSLPTACVSVDERSQLVSSTSLNETTDVQLCEVNSPVNDLREQDQVLNMPGLKRQGPNKHGLNPQKITFLNWNIYKGNGENWKQDLSSFADEHELMTIQEAYLDDQLVSLLDEHDFSWTMHAAFHLNGTAAGVMNVSSSDALHSCGFRVDEPIIRIPKAALISYYAIEGTNKKLLLANIHGINFTLGITAYAEQLEQLYDSVAHHDGPMIVAGDFNSWSGERLVQMKSLVERLALSKIEYAVNNKTHVFGNAIDHVFYRQLELVDNKVLQVSSSDHNPISVSFRLQ